MVFKGIVNKKTVDAFKKALDAASSLLGRAGAIPAIKLGLDAARYEWKVEGDKLNLIIEVK